MSGSAKSVSELEKFVASSRNASVEEIVEILGVALADVERHIGKNGPLGENRPIAGLPLYILLSNLTKILQKLPLSANHKDAIKSDIAKGVAASDSFDCISQMFFCICKLSRVSNLRRLIGMGPRGLDMLCESNQLQRPIIRTSFCAEFPTSDSLFDFLNEQECKEVLKLLGYNRFIKIIIGSQKESFLDQLFTWSGSLDESQWSAFLTILGDATLKKIIWNKTQLTDVLCRLNGPQCQILSQKFKKLITTPMDLTDVLKKLNQTQSEAVLSALGHENLIAIFTSKRNRYSALIIAVLYHPAAVTLILQLADRLPEQERVSILKDMLTAKYDNRNVLMNAAIHQPVAVSLVLDVVNCLPKEHRAPILKDMLIAKNTNGNNSLMRALQYHSAAVPLILEVMNGFPENERTPILKEMLTEKNLNGDNVLGLAVQYNQNAVDLILKTVTLLPEREQALILKSIFTKEVVLALKLNPNLVDLTLNRYTVDMIAKSAPLLLKLLRLPLPDSKYKHRVWSLYEFIKPNRVASAEQKQIVKDFFSATDTSKEEKANLLRRKPKQVARLILDEEESRIGLEIETFKLLCLLHSPVEPDNSQVTLNSERIEHIYHNLLKREIETEKAARLVMQIYNGKKNHSESSRTGVFSDQKTQSSPDGVELNSFALSGGECK